MKMLFNGINYFIPTLTAMLWHTEILSMFQIYIKTTAMTERVLFWVFFIAISLRRIIDAMDTCCDQKTFIKMGNILEAWKDEFCDTGGKIFTTMLAKYSYASHSMYILEILIITHVMKPLSVKSRWLIGMDILQSGMISI